MNIELEHFIDSRARFGYGKPPHPQIHQILNAGRDVYAEHLKRFSQFGAQLGSIAATEQPGVAPYWQNEFFSSLDAFSLHGFLGSTRPGTYLEIGSGNSTKFAHDAIQKHRLSTSIISIDPYPRVEIDALCSNTIRQRLEDTDLRIFEDLPPDSIVFFDGSHYCLMGSDATVFFLEVMPRLKPGILIHIHDIFLPNDYPPQWTKRYYSEQYLLAALLLGGSRNFRVEMPVAFAMHDEELMHLLDVVWQVLPSGMARYGGSFWMRRV